MLRSPSSRIGRQADLLWRLFVWPRAPFVSGYGETGPHAIDHAVAVLIVACPSPRGLATPLALTVALGRAAQQRILIKGGDVLEALAGRGVIFLDKTGTVTEGRMEVVSWAGDESFAAPRGGVGTSLGSSDRPGIGRRARRRIAAERTRPRRHRRGIDSRWRDPGTHRRAMPDGWIRRLYAQSGCAHRLALREPRVRRIASGAIPIIVTLDGQCVAVAGVADPVRKDVPSALAELQALGWRVRLLSGDHSGVVAAVAKQLELRRKTPSAM